MKINSILIIDDEVKLLKSLHRLLEGDYTALSAANGKKGLSIIRDTPPSLVLLDLKMPKMSGVEVLEAIRNTNSELKVLIMTGYRDWEWMTKCADFGIQGYIEKPFKPEALLDKIRNILGSQDCMVLREQWGIEYDKRFAALSPTIKKALQYLNKNNDRNVSRDEVAAYLETNPDYLSRIFNDECGIRLKKYINYSRILRMKDNLRIYGHSVRKVATGAGFQNVNYFCRLFKKQTGMTPTQFRKQS